MPTQDKIVIDALWCFRSETAKLLGLSVTQIHTSLTDGDNSVGTLTDSFSQLAEFCGTVQKLSSDHKDEHGAQGEINALANNMSETINNAIVAFQFYDRLSQRMEHVSSSLEQLSHLIKDDSNLNDPIGWEALRDHIRSSYSLDAEHVMYEAIMNGATTEEALDLYKKIMYESDASDDIELF
jgi:methyl-accepting chemotaxis protein